MRAVRKLRLHSLFATMSLVGTCGLSAAHTPYLLPSSFAVTKDHASLQAAMTEDVYFSPEFPVRATSYDVTGPNGQTSHVDTVTMTKDMAIVDVPIAADGTYRISTGSFVARTMKLAKVDGRWLMVRSAGDRRGGGAPRPAASAAGSMPRQEASGGAARRPDGPPRFVEEGALPAGAETIEVPTVLRTEAYVSKGAPSEAALQTSGQGLELKPLTHPNEIYLDKGFTFEMLLDGKPQKDLHIAVYRGGNTYEDRKVFAESRTNDEGKLSLTFDKPGVYLLSASYPGRRVEGQAPAPKNYTYSLTFEVQQ